MTIAREREERDNMHEASIDLLQMRFEEDRDYPRSDAICYFDTKTGDVFYHYETIEKSESEIGPACNEDWRKQNLMLNTEPERFLEVVGTDHGEWHSVFKEWLESIDKFDWYQDSIGRTLKDMTEDERHDWQSYRFDHADKKAFAFAKKYGFEPPFEHGSFLIR